MEVSAASSSSDSSDEEVLNFINNIVVFKNMRERRNPFQIYSDEDFTMRYRISKSTVQYLCEIISGNLVPVSQRKFTLSALEQVFITLRFFATGTSKIEVGDDMNVHKSTISRVICKVSQEIANLAKTYIYMPRTEEELRKEKTLFYKIGGFPNVIGCIDGCHIPILSPGGEQAELFRNEKGYFSINLQAVCDANLHIRDIVAHFHGSLHNSSVYHNSPLRSRLDNGEFNGHLLGDSTYPCGKHLLTPYIKVTGSAEKKYNIAHTQTLSTIERTFSLWKRRFPCLSQKLKVKLDRIPVIIVATAVLHNIALRKNDILMVDNYQHNMTENVGNQTAMPGENTLRRLIVEQYFRY